MCRKHDDDFLPYYTTLRTRRELYQLEYNNHTACHIFYKSFENYNIHLIIIHIVDFIKDNKLHVTDQVRSTVEHRAQDLGGHDQAARLGFDLHIAC